MPELLRENRLPVLSLRASLRPWRLHYRAVLGSTNDYAALLRRDGKLPAPAIVLTSRQVRGRGRGGNTWHAAPGSLTVTFALPLEERRLPQTLPLAAGVAVRRALVTLCGAEAIRLKWPNDLLHDDLKFAGLLCERVHGVDLVGVGVNVNLMPADLPVALRSRVTSLRAIVGRALPLADVLLCIAREFERVFLIGDDAPSLSPLLREFARHDALVGRPVRIEQAEDQPITGVAEGIDSSGRLLVRDRARLHRVVAGTVLFAD
jgi:BirA family biotin operon repressor/biotin-[acetyl-CoA-carboxylase] ligase